MAGVFGMEASMFCPSGTMTNQVCGGFFYMVVFPPFLRGSGAVGDGCSR